MRLLVDTDIFCKLSIAGLFNDAIVALGFHVADCGRLPALPHMLARGRLPKMYGAATCSAFVPVASAIPPIPSPNTIWIDRLASIEAIDPGEAQIFATAAQNSLVVLSGDKRALRALKHAEGYVHALEGRVIVLEALLLLLCEQQGFDVIRSRLRPLIEKDTMTGICFSAGTADPRIGLRSYYDELTKEVHPLVLWNPQQGAFV